MRLLLPLLLPLLHELLHWPRIKCLQLSWTGVQRLPFFCLSRPLPYHLIPCHRIPPRPEPTSTPYFSRAGPKHPAY